ncbi:executer 1 [Stylosanthes scabra]|uniref:Executer 1 n=1 Tax=Stylosanthes scabra TaxID=79078 RepID=A0ABU6S650_9FABA|nr:executer 1 [Stylosanthes scabra]
MFDLAKFIGKGKVLSKVLKEVGDLINLTLSQAQNHRPLSGTTTFNRIEISASLDPLNGLYVGAHGPFSSEFIQLRRRVGQWQEESWSMEPSDLEFYEPREALAEPGFKNPWWVDGELVILDGNHIKAGPVVGFVYWAPEYHFLV